MFLSRVLILSLLTVAIAAGAASPEAPDPARLDADWWTYFTPSEPLSQGELKLHVANMSKALEKLSSALDADARAKLSPDIVGLRESLAAYPASVEQRPEAPEALPPPQDSYSLNDAFARQKLFLGLSADIAAERDEIDWRRDLLTAERKQQSRAKVAYLAMEDTNPDRLAAGLALMASKFQLELDTLEIARRQQRLERLETQQTDMEKELGAIAKRLKLDPEDAEGWEKIREEALAEAARIRDEKIAPAGATSSTDKGVDAQRTRIEALRILYRDLRAKKEELLAARAELTTELIRFSTGGATDPGKMSSLIQDAEERLKRLTLRSNYWRSAVTRVQDKLASTTADEATDAKNPAIERQTLQLVESVSKANAAIMLEQDLLEFTVELARRRMYLGESTVKRGWSYTLEAVSDGWESAYGLLTAPMFEINETPVTLVGLLRILFILTIAWLLSKGLRRGLQRLAARRAAESQGSFYTLGRVLHYLILAVGILIGLSSIGIDFTKFALLASALGVGVGFGLQALVSNFVAGLIILFEKSLKVGDFVELESGVTGEVKEVNMRSTLITTNDNVDILVPNSEFINKEVTNWTLREAYRRIHVPFGVAYGTDKDLVKKAALEAAEVVKWTLKDNRRRAPQVWFVSFGDSSLDFELVVWLIPEAVKRPSAVQAAYLWEIETKLKVHGIEVPFPQRDLHLRSGFETVQIPSSPSGSI